MKAPDAGSSDANHEGRDQLELAETVEHLHISSLQMILSSFSRMTPKPFPPFNKLLIGTVTYLDKSSMLKSLNSFVPLTLVLTDNKP